MNSKQLRRSLKLKWLTYYRDNREWIDKLGIWSTYDGQRRPSSGFILGALAALEPNLNDLLPLVVDLSSNPDRIISALGLNLNPEQELEALEDAQRMLPSSSLVEAQIEPPTPVKLEKPIPQPVLAADEECTGTGGREDDRPRQ